MLKAFLAGVAVTLFILLAIGVVVLEQRKENARKANIEYVKEFTIRLREDSCAAHIGELKGAKHEAALKWFHALSLEGKEHRITEDDLKTCLTF
jgi:hypothetical protein